MGSPLCYDCGRTFTTLRGLTQHELACCVKKRSACRKILRMPDDPRPPKPVKQVKPGLFWSYDGDESITHTEREATFAFADIPTVIDDDIDDPFKSSSKTHAGIFPTTSAFRSIGNIDDLFTIPRQANTGMFSTTSAFKTKTYEEVTGWKAGACVPHDKEMEGTHDEDTHDKNTHEDTHDENKASNQCYRPFKHSFDYGMAEYFQRIGCTKGDVDLFFKSPLLETFSTDRKTREPFSSGLSFKSGEK